MTSDGDTMADYELLELILFAAKTRGDVKPLAKALLKQCGSFSDVLYADEATLARVDGAGPAVAATLKTIRVASQRMLKEEVQEKPVLQSWQALLDYCRLHMGKEKVEQFRILFLDHKNRLLCDEVQQRGTVNHTPVYPREVVKRALEVGASALILTHNHPSGDPAPSEADVEMTNNIVDAAEAISITVHDHLIIAGEKHYSFKSNGLL